MPSPKLRRKVYQSGLSAGDRWTLRYGYASSRDGGDPADLPAAERDRLRALWEEHHLDIDHAPGHVTWAARHFDAAPGPVHPYEHLGDPDA